MSLLPFTITQIVQQALLEDLGQGDVTVDHLPHLETQIITATINSRQAIVVSGLSVAELVFKTVDPTIDFQMLTQNGNVVTEKTTLATVHGPASRILKAERTALNFLQHLSGIATETRRYVDAISGTEAQITNTRKTTPGLRLLERQAVIDGGASPHRYNLGSIVMLKDNHLKQLPIPDAVADLRNRIGHTVMIEVETDTLEQVKIAVDAGADIILLDNMTPEQVKQAVAIIGNQAKIEASGNLTLETIRSYAQAGAQYLSTSKITLGAPAVDIGLDF